MALVFDNRAALGGEPGVHALICGVSNYSHLPGAGEPDTPRSLKLRKLSSTALSAYRVYRWLVDRQERLALPLATVRLLLAPSPQELAAEPGLAAAAKSCTLNDFLVEAAAWRKDAAAHPDGATVFYFAGHGAQRTRNDAVLLMQDFGDGIGSDLRNAANLNSIFYGMAPSTEFPFIALTQLYFIDACRDFLPAFAKYDPDDATPVFNIPQTTADTRCAPIYFAAAPGTQAQSVAGEGTLFSRALLACLENDAAEFVEVEGEDRWRVSVHSLDKALARVMAGLNEEQLTAQDYGMGGQIKEGAICELDSPPQVRVRLEVVPEDALPITSISVLDEQGQPLPALPRPLDPHPYEATWTAGMYTISAEVAPPHPHYASRPGAPRPVMPPFYEKKVKVAP